MVEGDLLQGAIRFARDLVARGDGPRKTRDLAGKLGTEEENAAIFSGARDLARKRDRGRIAPLKAIDAIDAATRLPFEAGCAREAELFMECLFSEQSKALIHVFFGEREVSRIPGLRKDAAVMDITAAAVVGGGTMGSGIAMTYANAGIPVILKEASSDASDRAMETIRRTYAGAVQKGRVEPHAAAQRLALIHPSITYDGFGDVDIVVEAVFEDIDLKRQVFAELDRVCRPGAVLATNTSTLDVDRIASATSRPAQVIGHHFFAPPHVMRLLEMVRGRQTSDEVIATTLSLAKKLGKVGVLVGNCRGFVGNRMYHQYQREAQLLVEEGASVEQVDLALYNFGMAMGPLAVADLSGLDVGRRIRNQNPGMEPEGTRRPVVADRLCDTGRLGQKTGAGWYRYEPGERRPIPDPAVAALIEECAREKGITRNSITPDVIVERTIYALINEGARILEEGIALRAVDIDIIYVHGYGFPAHRGGPMWFADTVGISKVYERVSGFQRQFGDTWAPAPLLKDLAATGLSFASLDQGRSTAKH
jgi:3-hydroxyacyl-CoA dehydrogenase